MTDRINIPASQDFVKPSLCYTLYLQGLHITTIFKWVVQNELASLHTTLFDIDDYYKEGFNHIMAVSPPSHILPAFQIKDVEKVLPSYLLTHNEAGYELSLDKVYNQVSVTSDRLPDVFALMLIDLLKARVLRPDECAKMMCEAKKE